MEIISTPVRSVQLVAQRVRKEASRRVVNKCKFSATAWAPTLATVPVGTPTSLSKSSGTVYIEGIQVKALFDSGSSESVIHPKYEGFKLSVLPELCNDLILGIDFQSQHSSVVFHYGGSEPPLSVDGLSTLNVDLPELFVDLTADCHKIASKSRRYSEEDQFCLH